MRQVAFAVAAILLTHMIVDRVNQIAPAQEDKTTVVVKPEPIVDEKAEPRAVIELQLADWCSPCRKFKEAKIIQELEAKGWTIRYVTNISSKYPSFRLTIDGESRSWTGYSSKSSFYKTLKKYMKDLGVDTG